MERELSPVHAQRTAEDLRTKVHPWEEIAASAAYGCQLRTLKLRPWQCPPCWANDEIDPTQPDRYGNMPDEVRFLQRMLAAGISRYEPDPLSALAAIERAEAEAAAPAA
jgi:hypothetical protein